VHAAAIHGSKSQTARERALADFRGTNAPVLVATDIAARGLDVDGITHVVNYDIPVEPETYVHRIGRTGRMGASGVAISFCDVEERPALRQIEWLMHTSIPVEGDAPPSVVKPAPVYQTRRRR
jgi:ATP-dependent RNA helicase RhlE